VWSTKTVNTIWEAFETLWHQRNQAKYGETLEEQNNRQKAEASAAIRRQYGEQQEVPQGCRSQIFHLTLQRRLNQRLEQQLAWLKSAEAAKVPVKPSAGAITNYFQVIDQEHNAGQTQQHPSGTDSTRT
jgi:hypothetical protein